MSELCRFNGIVIYMWYYDNKQHNKPHIHVRYGEFEAVFAFNGEIIEGTMPNKQAKSIVKWLNQHRSEVQEAWDHAVNGEIFSTIPPLK